MVTILYTKCILKNDASSEHCTENTSCLWMTYQHQRAWTQRERKCLIKKVLRQRDSKTKRCYKKRRKEKMESLALKVIIGGAIQNNQKVCWVKEDWMDPVPLKEMIHQCLAQEGLGTITNRTRVHTRWYFPTCRESGARMRHGFRMWRTTRGADYCGPRWRVMETGTLWSNQMVTQR